MHGVDSVQERTDRGPDLGHVPPKKEREDKQADAEVEKYIPKMPAESFISRDLE